MPQTVTVGHAPARPPVPDTPDFTIVVDNLPPHVSTTQLYVVFRRYGHVLRTWRTHFAQGMVSFARREEALAAAKAEDHRMIQEQPLRVSTAFTDTEPRNKDDWQCALCKFWNPCNENVCMGYMCGIQRMEGSIHDFEKCLDPVELGSSMQYYQHPQTQPQECSYYGEQAPPEQYNTEGYNTPSCTYTAPTPDAGYNGTTAPPQQSGSSTPTYSVTQVFPQQGTQPPQQQTQYPTMPEHPPHRDATYGVQPSYGMDSQPVPNETSTMAPMQTTVPPPPPQQAAGLPQPATGTQWHCVIVTNVPKNITEKTLLKVFTKYASSNMNGDEGPPARGWVRPCTPALPRALTEAHVVFARREDATAAVAGESGRVVDNEQIRCVYAAEAFSIAVVPEDPRRWAHIVSSEVERNAAIAELGEVFSLYGAVDTIRIGDTGATVHYYSMTSAADAIIAEDGGVRLKGAKIHVGLAPGSRWPCTNCGRCNPGGHSKCDGCGAAIAPVDQAAAWRWRELMKENVQAAAQPPPPPRYDPGDAYNRQRQPPSQQQGVPPAPPPAPTRHTLPQDMGEDPSLDRREDDAHHLQDGRRRRRRGGRNGDNGFDGDGVESDLSASQLTEGSSVTTPSNPDTPTLPISEHDAPRRGSGSAEWRRAPPPPPPVNSSGVWSNNGQPPPRARTGRGHRGGASRRK